jgi:hypothetical protein
LEGFQRALLCHGIVANLMSSGIKQANRTVIKSGPAKGKIINIVGGNEAFELRIHFADAPWLGVQAPAARWKANKIVGGELHQRIYKIEKKRYSGLVYDLETPRHDLMCGQITAQLRCKRRHPRR